MRDNPRDRILARRARFVGAALATAGLATGGMQACGAAQPCLSVVAPESEDAGTDAASSVPTATSPEPSETGTPVSTEPPPDVCLSPPEEELPPDVCLRAAPPRGE